MSKSNNHRFKAAPSGPRYRWMLPQDMREVKLLAFQQGILCATEQKKQGVELTPEGIEAGAIDAALRLEQESKGGKQGCNNRSLFRKTFADMCAVIWSAVYTYWNEAPEVYADFLHRPPSQQVSNARQMAELYLDPVERRIAAGETITFEW